MGATSGCSGAGNKHNHGASEPEKGEGGREDKREDGRVATREEVQMKRCRGIEKGESGNEQSLDDSRTVVEGDLFCFSI